MSTTQDIIDRSLRLILQLDTGTLTEDSESDDALTALNAMLDSWRNDRLMCYAFRDESLTMVNAQSSYQIGPGGDLSTTRPIAIENAYIVQNNNSYYVWVISDAEYDALPSKLVTSSWPEKINYRPSMSTGTLYTYPVSNGTAATLHMRTRTPLTALARTDTLALPPGWEEALATNLALRLAPEYSVTPDPMVLKMAQESKALLMRTNSQPIKAYTELPWLSSGSGHRANILTDQP